MADDAAPKPVLGQPGQGAPETRLGRQDHLGVEVGMPLAADAQKPGVTREKDHGLAMQTDGTEATFTRTDTNEADTKVKLDKDGKPITTPETPADGTQPEAKTDAPAATTELPKAAFDAAKPEVVAEFDKAYVGADGKFNAAALTADWSRNAKAGPDGAVVGQLSEDTYKYLETKGLSRDTVKAVEAGQVALTQQKRSAVFNAAGGQEAYAAALAWATTGKGYDAAARAKFNQDIDAGGASQKDAVDLLMQRFKTANPPARRASPAKTAADAGGPGGGPADSGAKPFTNYKEYSAAFRKAQTENNQQALNEVRARAKVTPFLTGK